MSQMINGVLVCLVSTSVLLLSSFRMADSFLTLEPKTSKYVAQVKVFVDSAGREKWRIYTGKQSNSQLKDDVQIVFDQMNMIFGRMKEQYNLDLQLELKDVVPVHYHNSQTLLKSANNGKLDAANGVRDFQEWISNRYQEHEFDLALLFTSNDLFVGSSYLNYGVAADYGVVCTKRAVGIVEMFTDVSVAADEKTSHVARYAAHEIGHILGAKHNDDEPLCRDQKGYIMAANAKKQGPHVSDITQCTAKSIAALMESLTEEGNNCLLPGKPEVTAADKACQEREGSSDWFMSRRYKEYGDKMCENLYCISWNGEKRVYSNGKPAPDGLGCGKNKRCQQGRCVLTDDGDPDMADNCPWGNQDLRKIGYRNSCEAQSCETWATFCCQHCNALDKELERLQG